MSATTRLRAIYKALGDLRPEQEAIRRMLKEGRTEDAIEEQRSYIDKLRLEIERNTEAQR